MERRWHRSCPSSVEVRSCVGKGSGLFARAPVAPGDTLFEEDPLSGSAILLFDETRAPLHCSQCISLLPEDGAVRCPRKCAVHYCSQSCCDEAWWTHHEILCTEASAAWADFLTHASDCGNEYYVLAGRMFASLRHCDGLGEDGYLECGPPWAAYASPLWWETMQRPVYSDSDSDSSHHSVIDGSHTGSDNEGSETCGCSDDSLDMFFASKIQAQTEETVILLRRVLSDANTLTPYVDSVLNCESFSRLVGLLRVNTLAVQAASFEGDESCLRGMALYPVMSAMNHCPEPNCFAASDPATPHRAIIRSHTQVDIGEELCIDYLAGAPYDANERERILRSQYLIPDVAAVQV